MEMKDYQQIVEIIEEQEKVVRPEHFLNKDMLKLGNFMVDEAEAQGAAVSIAIAKPSGAIVFQHLMEGTNACNQSWMQRKFNMCAASEHSSLRAWCKEILTGETMDDYGQTPQQVVYAGGAFPIFLKSGEFVGVATVSGFPHMKDHQFCVNCVAKWIGMDEVPQVPFFDVWREK